MEKRTRQTYSEEYKIEVEKKTSFAEFKRRVSEAFKKQGLSEFAESFSVVAAGYHIMGDYDPHEENMAYQRVKTIEELDDFTYGCGDSPADPLYFFDKPQMEQKTVWIGKTQVIEGISQLHKNEGMDYFGIAGVNFLKNKDLFNDLHSALKQNSVGQ